MCNFNSWWRFEGECGAVCWVWVKINMNNVVVSVCSGFSVPRLDEDIIWGRVHCLHQWDRVLWVLQDEVYLVEYVRAGCTLTNEVKVSHIIGVGQWTISNPPVLDGYQLVEIGQRPQSPNDTPLVRCSIAITDWSDMVVAILPLSSCNQIIEVYWHAQPPNAIDHGSCSWCTNWSSNIDEHLGLVRQHQQFRIHVLILHPHIQESRPFGWDNSCRISTHIDNHVPKELKSSVCITDEPLELSPSGDHVATCWYTCKLV